MTAGPRPGGGARIGFTVAGSRLLPGAGWVLLPEITGSAKAPIPRAGHRSVPSVRVILCFAWWVSKQYRGRPLRHARH
ncbi:hypothetical protein AQJ64_25740 [Streptomyces griseoruber]|uniref:Uncharacterized protein n=1 Tax=Streptomyces griseoruber TaxID=1943 RepID=A0A101SUM2_9ACTN|nr:hypothetical protein AQJ64_25740 [Streptomyces griseoruber]